MNYTAGSYSASAPSVCETPRDSPIQDALRHLEDRLVKLNVMMEHLESRVSVAIRPSPVGKCAASNPDKPQQPSALVVKINAIDEQASKIEARLTDLLDGLDL